MASDYEEICQDNIRRRGEEFDDIGRFISEQLYSDRTHFILELLQNAEDALARRHRNTPNSTLPNSVNLVLYENRLEFRHFGEVFNSDDVKAITDVLRGTKTEDRAQIGKFGIGFKSVYAFTSTPQIHSGGEDFEIKRYIRPRSIDSLSVKDSNETVFIFPFDHSEISAEKTYSLIETKLRQLGPRVLLFLKHISEIAWVIDGKDSGQYLKESSACGHLAKKVTLIGQRLVDRGDVDDEEWLVFKKDIPLVDESEVDSIEIAFRVIEDRGTQTRWVERNQASFLNIYFPTKIDTRFGFLLQGPFNPTGSRSEIEESDWNEELVKMAADFLADEVLPAIKEMGLLSVSFLESLPIKTEDFPETGILYPIVRRVRDVLSDGEFIPTSDGKHVSARNAKLAGAEWLRSLLSGENLQQLFKVDDSLKWVTGEITERAKHDLWRYLRDELSIDEITPDSFARRIDGKFLEVQTDVWIEEFYQQVSALKGLWRKGDRFSQSEGILRAKPFIRIQDGSQVRPFRSDQTAEVFLPVDTDASMALSDLPTVKSFFCENVEIAAFLRELGIPSLDLVEEVIVKLLPKYKSVDKHIAIEEHMNDMIVIEEALGSGLQTKRSKLMEHLRNTPFVLVENPVSGSTSYNLPDDTYINNDGLTLYFSGNRKHARLSDRYSESAIELFKALGASESVRVQRKLSDAKGYVKIANRHSYHKRGHNSFDPDIKVDGIEWAVTNATPDRSEFVWNNVIVHHAACIRGIVETSKRQTFEASQEEERVSKFGKLLIETAWLPSRDGELHRPRELFLKDLPESFRHSEELAKQLGMKLDLVTRLAEELGVPATDIEFMKEHSDEFSKWKSEILSRSRKGQFPSRTSSDPERRQDRRTEQLDKSTDKTYEQKPRSVRTSQKAISQSVWLKNQYTNELGYMYCQICREEMPFRKRNGEYYFEAIEILTDGHFPKEDEAQYLALCPVCAAKYREFVQLDKAVMAGLRRALESAETLEVPLRLGTEETSILFVETHALDIKTILSIGPSSSHIDHSLTSNSTRSSSREPDAIQFFIKSSLVDATGEYSNGVFILYEGSKCCREASEALSKTHQEQRRSLIDAGILRIKGSHLILIKDHVFKTPSSAGVVVLGQENNGWLVWKTESGRTLNDVFRRS